MIPMESRRTALRPPSPRLMEQLYVRSSMGEFPYLWRGAPETPQAFSEMIWHDVLVQFAIEDRREGHQIGLIGAYGANPFHGYAFATFTLLPEYERRVWPYEAVVLFGNYVFTRFNLQNLYAETTGPLYEQFRSGAGRLFSELGRFPGRLVIDSVREDLVVTGISRAQWDAEGVPLLERCTAGVGEPR